MSFDFTEDLSGNNMEDLQRALIPVLCYNMILVRMMKD